jgi:hypothetical protein
MKRWRGWSKCDGTQQVARSAGNDVVDRPPRRDHGMQCTSSLFTNECGEHPSLCPEANFCASDRGSGRSANPSTRGNGSARAHRRKVQRRPAKLHSLTERSEAGLRKRRSAI